MTAQLHRHLCDKTNPNLKKFGMEAAARAAAVGKVRVLVLLQYYNDTELVSRALSPFSQ